MVTAVAQWYSDFSMNNLPASVDASRSDPNLLRYAKEFQSILAEAGVGEIPADLIASKAQQFMDGLPVEDEFQAFALWSERCVLIHKLDQDQMPSSSRHIYQVPDFFMAMSYQSRIVKCLVEVKKRNLKSEAPLDKDTLRFTRAYHDRLINYANLLGLPLLVAWKAEPFGWLCFDIQAMKKVKTAFRISVADAMMANVLGLLLGDFSFHLRENAAFVLKIERLTDGTNEFEGITHDAHWQAYDGQRVSLKSPFMDIFMFCPDNVESTDVDGFVTQRFYKVDTSSVFGQSLLSLACHGYSDDPGPWRTVFDKGFRYTLPDLRRCAEDAARKGMIETIIEMAPRECPDFLLTETGETPRSHILVGRGGGQVQSEN